MSEEIRAELTDRELLMALFNLVGKLARRLTGDMPLVCVHGEDGIKRHFYPAVEATAWIPPGSPPRCPLCNPGDSVSPDADHQFSGLEASHPTPHAEQIVQHANAAAPP
jgi:hypothetical protein